MRNIKQSKLNLVLNDDNLLSSSAIGFSLLRLQILVL
ncbi:hypothetical protein GNIT_2950 [Glaciecola nitratireducens FR1064]|uniref:Uncharacterized protein n=1 Tax=Glaciecola nitratireducens (strain JCM 12485 / KCTC 12276 / FR1064) TaxID=1085623 RepID=G4QMW4_GLANF|nr:hypothetical protein GNIT_2950 [Glaciecola nitratireducens FR1064]